MQHTVLGRTGLRVSATAFGCLPIQRIDAQEAARMLRRAVDGGITFFDTARAYSDSEEKMGLAFEGMRDRVIIATKTGAKDADAFWADLRQSLRMLRTDHIDVYQFHMPSFVPRPGGADGLYDAAVEARERGMIRHIGITQHSVSLAEEAVQSGLYDTLQYPFNHLATPREVALVESCAAANVGFICMKALSGGLITDASAPFAFIAQYPHAVPIWGFQHMHELEQLLVLSESPPAMDEDMRRRIEADREALGGAFCRGCGYCMPCPAGIPLYNANRMSQLITRSPSAQWMTPEWREGMQRIEGCTRCGLCHTRCPYGLKPYETLPEHLRFYREYVASAENAVTIRPYTDSDRARVADIHDRARKLELAHAGLPDAFLPFAETAEEEGFFGYTVNVAVQGGELRGFVAFSSDELAWLYVDPAHMRKGIARALIAHTLQSVTQRPLNVEVLAGNDPAIRLYHAMGFQDVQTLTGKMPGNEAFTVTVLHLQRA